MKVIFYDKKNRCEVSNKQLMGTKIIEEIVVTDKHEPGCTAKTGKKIGPHGVCTREEYDKDFSLDPNYEGPAYDDLQDDYTVTKSWVKENIIGELGYKSPNCPSYMNWDNYLMESDLVFLRLEDDD